MRKIIGFISVLLIFSLAFTLSGCGIISWGHTEENPAETTDSEITARDEKEDIYISDYESEINGFIKDLSGKTYGGGTFQIAVGGKNLITPDDKTSDVISKDIEERNASVERTLDISIISKKVNVNTMYNEVRAAIQSGSYYADLLMIPQINLGAFVTAGEVINLRSLPGLDLNTDYIYSTSVKAGTGGDAVYAVAGCASLDPDSLSCIYFNKDLVEKAGLESPYSLVKKGEWTADKYKEYAMSVSKLDGEYYSYGAQNTSPYLADLFYFSFGGKLTDSNVGYYPVMATGSDGVSATVDKVASCVNLEKRVGSSLEGINCFKSGNTMFLCDRLSTMKALADCNVNWGVVPFPKSDAVQSEYRSLAYYGDAQFFAGIATAPDYEEVADVISALNIMAYGYSNDSYITDASYYCLRDNESMNMLSKVLKCPVYDFAYSFSEVNSYVSNGTFMAVRNTVAGISSLQRYVDMYAGLFENSMYSMFKVN